jgi:hypothetical protein
MYTNVKRSTLLIKIAFRCTFLCYKQCNDTAGVLTTCANNCKGTFSNTEVGITEHLDCSSIEVVNKSTVKFVQRYLRIRLFKAEEKI